MTHLHLSIVLATLVTCAAPANSQDFAIDDHLIDRCLAIQDNPMICVARQAEECIERNGGGPNMVLAACYEAEAAVWDRALNSAYRDLQRYAREREAADVGYEPDALINSLRDMQRAWIAYRDATCANALALARPFGSAAGPAGTKCRMIETARQFFALNDLRQDYDLR